MRVPTSTQYSRLERGLGVSLARVQQLQGQLASGSRISKPSDDPVGASVGLRLRAQEASWTAYRRTADDAIASLATTDAALQSSSSLLRRARELSVQAVNGAYGPAERAALADEVAQIRLQVVELANTRHLGRAVFGGHQGTAIAADGSWAGDTGVVSRQVSPEVTVVVNLDGRQVFGFGAADDQDVFSVLSRLERAVRAGDVAAITTSQAEVRARFDSVVTGLGQVGALQNRVESATALGQAALESIMQHRSQVEDVDLAAAIMRLQTAQTGYQAALGAVGRANLPSLADFLR